MASFNKFSGAWTQKTTSHLLRRTTYGVPLETLRQMTTFGLDGCIAKLFEAKALPDLPINYSYADDPDVPIGETWVDKGYVNGVNSYRNGSIRSWTIENLSVGDANIREKMTMFWHNHFVTADNNDPRWSYYYITLLRTHCIGNFKQLTKDITIDTAMLNYLNGRENTRQAPNENFARELMELFTLGKGDIAGPGDYTTFTEKDVKEMARSFTGWVDTRGTLPLKAEFRPGRHDTGSKTLSPRFGNVVINDGGIDEYKQVIDIIFAKPEVSKFIARKLYRWFVSLEITSEIETDIIAPLATLLRQNNYEVSDAVKALLSSEHFFDTCISGTIIKNPIDFVTQLINNFQVDYTADVVQKQRQYLGIYTFTNSLQMAVFQAPNVAGWSPYYQAPVYDGLWLNSTTLPVRKNFTDALAGNGYVVNMIRFKIDHIKFLNLLNTPSDANAVLDQTLEFILSNPVAANQRTTLKTVFFGTNMTDAKWKTSYDDYVLDPTSEPKRTVLIQRLSALLIYIMRMPEYHLS